MPWLGKSYAHERTRKDPNELRYPPEEQAMLLGADGGGINISVIVELEPTSTLAALSHTLTVPDPERAVLERIVRHPAEMEPQTTALMRRMCELLQLEIASSG